MSNSADKQVSERDSLVSTVSGWLEDGSTIVGVFENVALDSQLLGHRVAFPFELDLADRLILGSTRAPDSAKLGFIGWRYVLKLKSTDAEEVVGSVLCDDLVPLVEGS
ncbi:MAG TPA: hypothetical protein VM285_04760 [Polyangia bacterium]|nr:hypothetical protein [Polyangia bacterium]